MSPTLPLALKKCKSVSPDQCHINVEPCPPFLLPLCRAAGDRRQLPEKWENLGKIVGIFRPRRLLHWPQNLDGLNESGADDIEASN